MMLVFCCFVTKCENIPFFFLSISFLPTLALGLLVVIQHAESPPPPLLTWRKVEERGGMDGLRI
jgi:hypothetical protein